jgi:hypothetical protein
LPSPPFRSRLSAQAEEGEKSGAQSAPIPTLHCEFKSVNACSPDGGCKEGKDLAGMPLPLKVTVDFENTVVASVDDTGYARTDNFDSAANSADQMVVHGIDGPFTWQWPSTMRAQPRRSRLLLPIA